MSRAVAARGLLTWAGQRGEKRRRVCRLALRCAARDLVRRLQCSMALWCICCNVKHVCELLCGLLVIENEVVGEGGVSVKMRQKNACGREAERARVVCVEFVDVRPPCGVGGAGAPGAPAPMSAIAMPMGEWGAMAPWGPWDVGSARRTRDHRSHHRQQRELSLTP
jgi:hypothetical protein